MRTAVKDSTWIRQAFMLPERAIDDKVDTIRRIYTTAEQKYTDTTLGGNFCINPFPQFTRFADIKRNADYAFSKGMGRFYSEVIDDNAQIIHIRLGVPKFNSLTRFFGDFYSVEASSLARTGRAPGAFYEMGKVTGSIITLPLQPIFLVSKMIRFFLEKPASRYYYLKPTMPLYWNAVSTMVNGVAVNMGVIPRVLPNDQNGINEPEDGQVHADQLKAVAMTHKLLPDIYRKDGGIDIYAVSNKAQRLANAYRETMENEIAQSRGQTDLVRRMNKLSKWKPASGDVGAANLRDYMNLYMQSQDGSFDQANPESMESDKRDEGWIGSMDKFFKAERMMGSDFVTFRVDHTGTQAETFSSSAKESGIAGTINSMSSKSRSTRFDLANGNIDSAGLSEKIIGAVTSYAAGIGEQFEVSGIAALAGSAFADIPDTWDSSSADVGRSSFTIPLRSPYGNDLSRLNNLVVPMCMLLAMALPLSAGKQSYTAPFICELFNRGRTQGRLMMVDSLSFTRGVGDVGWTNQGKYLGVDCTISFIDLSKVVHMPINASFSIGQAIVAGAGAGAGAAGASIWNAVGGNADVAAAANTGAAVASTLMKSTYDDDNKYTDYLAVLGSLPMDAQINTLRKLKLRMTQQMAEFNAWKSPAHFANWSMGGLSGDILKAFSMRTDRP